jgi:outer membrane protein
MKRVVRFIITFSLLSVTLPVYAANLLEVYEQAAGHDPIYKKAAATRLALREAKPQSIAGLLPTVGGAASATSTRSRIPGQRPDIAKYGLETYSLNFTQPIFNFASWMTVRQASAQVKQADAAYGAAMQDLMLRVSAAYFNVLQAEDQLRITQAQKKVLMKQLDEGQQRYEVGVNTMTDVYNAQANHDLIIAQEIIDKNGVNTAYETLRGITGQRYTSLAKLNHHIPLVSPNPADIDKWVQAARQQNFNLKAFRFAADAARENIKIQAGGHVPSVGATGGYTRNIGGPPPIGGVSVIPAETSALGLTLNVPIFQGGLVMSQVRRAQAQYQQATADMEFTHENVVTGTRQMYASVLADIAKIKADQQSIKSNSSSFESNQSAYRAGVKTNTDVLLAQKLLFDAERQYAVDQYIYLNDTLKLKNFAGTLHEKDLQIINSWLKVERKDKNRNQDL